jgi:hypothetical protein
MGDALRRHPRGAAGGRARLKVEPVYKMLTPSRLPIHYHPVKKSASNSSPARCASGSTARSERSKRARS